MNVLPIVQRELIVASRRRWTFWLRMGSAVLACFLGLMILLASTASFNPGSAVFNTLTILGFLFACFAGVFITSDCISSERREGTLGLLFLTDLYGFDVVLGKLAALFIPAMFGLLAAVPVLAFSLLWGGVTNGEFWRMVAVLLVVLFFSQSIGISVSVFVREERAAMGLSAFLILLFTLGCTAVSWLPDVLIFPAICERLSPWNLMRAALEAGYTKDAGLFWEAGGSLLGISLLALLVGSWKLPGIWRTEPVTTTKDAWWNRDVLKHKTRGRRGAVRNRNPVQWITGDRGTFRAFAWLLAGLAMIVQVGALPLSLSSSGLSELFYPFFWSLGAVVVMPFVVGMKILIVLQATRFFVASRRNGALDLLVATPLTSREVVVGIWRMMLDTFRWPLGLLIAAQWVPVFGLAVMQPVTAFGTPYEESFLLTASSVTQIVEALALCWLGVYLALKVKRPSLAVPLTLLYGFVLPTVFCLPSVLTCGVLAITFHAKVRQRFRLLAQPDYWPRLGAPTWKTANKEGR